MANWLKVLLGHCPNMFGWSANKTSGTNEASSELWNGKLDVSGGRLRASKPLVKEL